MSNARKCEDVPVRLLTRSLTNPFAAYVVGFALAVSVYSLDYSDLYPPLQPSLEWFLLLTCLICVFLAYGAGKIVGRHTYRDERFRTHVTIFFFLLAVFLIEVIANGGVPLLLLVTIADFNYKDFGIPTLHVAFTGFSFFYAVYWFDLYVLGQGKKYLALSIPTFATSLLIVSRGAFIILLVAMLVVYIRRRGFNRQLLLSFAGIVAVVIWGFGVLGNLRSNDASAEKLIYAIGKPSDKFLKSSIPAELFWTYLYTSSPLANLQLNITDRTSADSPMMYFILECLPDFVSKRFLSDSEIAAAAPILNTEQLNVSTMYGRGFFLMGWMGAIFSFCYFVIFSIICIKILQRSKYFVATLGILSAIAFLEIFDNMIVFAGGLLPVLVALLLRLFERRSEQPGANSSEWIAREKT